MAVSVAKSGANPLKVLQFTHRYATQAVQKTNVKHNVDLKAIRERELNPAPQDLGQHATKMKITNQADKSLQDHFIDQYI